MTNLDSASAGGTEAAKAAAALAATAAGANGADKSGGSGKDGAADPFSGLDTGTRSWVESKGYKTAADTAKAAFAAEQLISKSVQLPGEDAKPEDWAKVYDRLGRPKSADGYEFKLPDGLPAELPYDADFAKAFKAEAHKAGLTPKQATAAHDFYVQSAAKNFTDQQQKLAADVTAADEALVKKWGAKDSEGFKASADYAFRAVKGLGWEKALQAKGLLGPNDLVTNADIALAMEKIGRVMFKEDSLEQGSGGVASDNPFKDGPSKGNLTEQMIAIRKDRAGAERLIVQAGHKPADFGLS